MLTLLQESPSPYPFTSMIVSYSPWSVPGVRRAMKRGCIYFAMNPTFSSPFVYGTWPSLSLRFWGLCLLSRTGTLFAFKVASTKNFMTILSP